MGWRFRKSFTPFPGVRLTLSPKGFSTSIGAGPFRLTRGSQGTALTTRVPGTGISFRKNILEPKVSTPKQPEEIPAWVRTLNEPETTTADKMEEISSAGSSVLTTSGLIDYRQLLVDAHRERTSILRELDVSRTEEDSAKLVHMQWKNGWLYRRIFPNQYASLQQAHDDATAKREELEEQESQSRVYTEIELPDSVRHRYARMLDVFVSMSRARKIWDTTSHREANRVVERTSASRVLTREPVRFGLAQCDLIESEWKVPHLENFNGGDLYLYPGFLLYFVSKDAFALLEIAEFKLSVTTTRFIEEGEVPADAIPVDATWAKVNKDGTPDKRFRDNYQIPILAYGKINISSSTGLNEEFMISDPNAAVAFADAWAKFAESVQKEQGI